MKLIKNAIIALFCCGCASQQNIKSKEIVINSENKNHSFALNEANEYNSRRTIILTVGSTIAIGTALTTTVFAIRAAEEADLYFKAQKLNYPKDIYYSQLHNGQETIFKNLAFWSGITAMTTGGATLIYGLVTKPYEIKIKYIGNGMIVYGEF